MSGPKIDQAEVEERRRRQLENERRLRIEKIMQAYEVHNSVVSDVRKAIMEIQNDQETRMAMLTGREPLQMALYNIRVCKSDKISDLLQLTRLELPPDAEGIMKAAEYLKAEIKSIRTSYDEVISESFKRIDEYLGDQRMQGVLEGLTSELDSMEVYANVESLDFTFAKKKILESTHITAPLKDQATSDLDEVMKLLCAESLTRGDRSTVMGFAGEIIQSQEAEDQDLKKILWDFSLAKETILSRTEDFEELYNEYIAHYVIYHHEALKSREEKSPFTPNRRNQFSSITALEAEVNLLKQKLKKVHEENYIREQFNEVMKIFGYEMCEELVLDTAQKGHHYLSPSSDRKTGIHIYMSDSRQVMMEIVAMEDESSEQDSGVNALSLDSTLLNTEEKQSMLQEQQSFCDTHPGIVEQLRLRGVILHARTHRPPALQHAKKFLVLSRYSDLSKSEDMESSGSISSKSQQKKRKIREIKRGV